MNNKKLFKGGMSMMEVIVAIAVFSIIILAVTAMFSNSWKNHKFIINTNAASISANQGVSKIVDVVRKARIAGNGAYPIQLADDFELIIFSDIDKDNITEKVHYYIDNGNIMVGIINPSGFPVSYPIADEEIKVITRNITNNSVQPIFYYYDDENNIINTPIANISNIKMVEVNLFIARKEGDLNIESYASMRNLSEHDRIE